MPFCLVISTDLFHDRLTHIRVKGYRHLRFKTKTTYKQTSCASILRYVKYTDISVEVMMWACVISKMFRCEHFAPGYITLLQIPLQCIAKINEIRAFLFLPHDLPFSLSASFLTRENVHKNMTSVGN